MPGTDDADPRIGIVMITKDRRRSLLSTLPRLLALPERPPVVVVDNASSDGSATTVRRLHPEVTVLRLERNAGAAGRNVGVSVLGTPYVAFADDDSWWEPGALRRAADVLDRHPRLALLAARVEVGSQRALDPTCAAMAEGPLPPEPDLPGPPVLGFIACGAVVRADAFLGVGGFSAMMQVGGEERLVALDLATQGWGLCYVDDVVAVHEPTSQRDREARRRRVIRNDLWHAWLRRRWPAALRHTAGVAVRATHDRAARRALLDAIGGVGQVLPARRPLPRPLERQVRALDAWHPTHDRNGAPTS